MQSINLLNSFRKTEMVLYVDSMNYKKGWGEIMTKWCALYQ